ncbi:MAG: hypothetical protein OXE49_20290, partial [Gemmatimonadetes bacterium]|nr:hypothetical protein [Gemmatimonadota bacterium]
MSEIDDRLTEKGVLEDFHHQPQLMMKLAENTLLVAESLRDNYFRNTARFISHLRRAIDEANRGTRDRYILQICSVS